MSCAYMTYRQLGYTLFLYLYIVYMNEMFLK